MLKYLNGGGTMLKIMWINPIYPDVFDEHMLSTINGIKRSDVEVTVVSLEEKGPSHVGARPIRRTNQAGARDGGDRSRAGSHEGRPRAGVEAAGRVPRLPRPALQGTDGGDQYPVWRVACRALRAAAEVSARGQSDRGGGGGANTAVSAGSWSVAGTLIRAGAARSRRRRVRG